MTARARKKPMRFPDLGRLDVGLNVKDVRRSAAFYEKLGFREAEGNRKEGWTVLVRGDARVGLFHGFIKGNMLNFRGGDVKKIVRGLNARRLKATDVRIVGDAGAGRATLKDPDGNVIFFDSTLAELDRRKRARR